MTNISRGAFYEKLLTPTQGESIEHIAASMCLCPLPPGKQERLGLRYRK